MSNVALELRDSRSKNQLVIVGIILVALQFGLVPHIGILHAQPNLLLVLTYLIALRLGAHGGVIAGFSLGLLYDLLTVNPVGAMSLIGAIAGFLVGSLLKEYVQDNFRTAVITFMPIALIVEMFYAILLLTLGYESSFFTTLGLRVLPSVLFDIVAATLVFLAMNALTNRGSWRSGGSRYR